MYKRQVLIDESDDQKTWSTVGVSPNIIEASWQALVGSLEYGLLCRELPEPDQAKEVLRQIKKEITW